MNAALSYVQCIHTGHTNCWIACQTAQRNLTSFQCKPLPSGAGQWPHKHTWSFVIFNAIVQIFIFITSALWTDRNIQSHQVKQGEVCIGTQVWDNQWVRNTIPKTPLMLLVHPTHSWQMNHIIPGNKKNPALKPNLCYSYPGLGPTMLCFLAPLPFFDGCV